MQSSLKGKVVLVTGGARGLGHAVATAFAQAGAVGVVADLPSASRMLPPDGMVALDCDVTSEASVATCVAATVEQFGQLDVVIANAGLVPGWRTTEALDFDEWDRVMAVNARGVALTLARTAKALSATRGSVVVMASINAYAAHARQMLYTASKHAVLGIVRSAARDLGPQRQVALHQVIEVGGAGDHGGHQAVALLGLGIGVHQALHGPHAQTLLVG